MSRKPKTSTSGQSSLLEPGRNCWRIERAERAALVVDAADYFRLARDAMLNAKSQILLIGWDLDTRIKMIGEKQDESGEADVPVHLGPFLAWLAKRRPELRIYILAWNGELLSLLGRGTTLARMAVWRMLNKTISFRLDHTPPLAASHHHKILVIDDALAFCGGIDMTGSRWDTRNHKDDEPGRQRPTTHRPYGPWHDATMAVDGAVARALGDLGRQRWKEACNQVVKAPSVKSDPWPDDLAPDFHEVEISISRTRGDANGAEIREIEALFVDLINSAERFLYVEQQYFASRIIAEAMAKRLSEADPPEVLIVNPCNADGWLEEEMMGAARAELVEILRKADHKDRFRIYYPVTTQGENIYVHAKIMIVDDVVLKVGSANMNNRSLGLDSECDVTIDARRPANEGCRKKIEALRFDLMAEHLGVAPAKVARAFNETNSLIATVDRLRGDRRSLRLYQPPEFSAPSKALAKAEVADPESAAEPFEPFARRRLVRGFLQRLRGRRG
ncbi:MAG TPA: phospholipase D-like domain-containing protein [Allosphingosinicella sp.]|nr:phospholipase D-like domain-containing protein [Allosphingosinicella sp.]